MDEYRVRKLLWYTELVKHVLDHFKLYDPILHAAAPHDLAIAHWLEEDLFVALCESIISQQLSIKAADTIFGRFKKLFPKGNITPKKTLKLSVEQMRGVGMSYGKASYVLDLAQKVHSEELILKNLHDLEDEMVITELTKVKGIGRWTAEMFLMFALRREDVFSYGDLGIRKGIQKLYKLKKEPTPRQAETIAKKWIPYRSYACKILWKSLES